MVNVVYISNNENGWKLSDDDWKTLYVAGWNVEWLSVENSRIFGASAISATKEFATREEGIKDWERALGIAASTDPVAHNFYVYAGPAEPYGREPFDDMEACGA